MTSVPRETVADRYELLEMIGQGGQALVFAANDLREHRRVAVKVMSRAVSRDPQWVERMAREQQAMVSLAGTNAVGFIDLCTSKTGALCLVMELLEGSDLEEHQHQCETVKAPMALDDVVGLMGPIVDTLEKAHTVGIVHRDLKPGNIFLEEAESGRVPRLLDFGFARTTQSKQVTETGTILGSPSYIAPEMWLTLPDAVDPRVDVYSLGVILYRLLTLELPFAGDSLQAKFIAATSAERPSLHQRRPDLPMNVDLWVERALAIEPGDRFPTVRALWAELLWALERGPHPHESKRKKAAEPRELERIREWLQAPLGSLPNPLGAAWRVAAGMFSRLRGKAPSKTAPLESTAAAPEPMVRREPEPSAASPAPQVPATAETEDRDTMPESPRANERAAAPQVAADETKTLLRVVSVQPPDAPEADEPTPEHKDSRVERSIDAEEEALGVERETRPSPSAEPEQSAEIATPPRRAGKKIATRKRGSSARPPAPAQTSARAATAEPNAKKARKKTVPKKATTSKKAVKREAKTATTSKKALGRSAKKTKGNAANASKSAKVAKATKKVAKKATRKAVARGQARSSKVRGSSATTTQKKRPTKKRPRVNPKGK